MHARHGNKCPRWHNYDSIDTASTLHSLDSSISIRELCSCSFVFFDEHKAKLSIGGWWQISKWCCSTDSRNFVCLKLNGNHKKSEKFPNERISFVLEERFLQDNVIRSITVAHETEPYDWVQETTRLTLSVHRRQLATIGSNGMRPPVSALGLRRRRRHHEFPCRTWSECDWLLVSTTRETVSCCYC